ncbi:MotE family protein [Bacillus smithii]|uniref:MotE family protein n=1 Tax=Bacillus smithii TaxID=1479 RepID=UPI0030C900AC
MAKNKKSGKLDQEEKGYSLFQWILFVGIIPLVFAAVIAYFVMSVSGVSFADAIKKAGGKIPFLDQMAASHEQKQKMNEYVHKIATLEKEVKKKQSKIDQLQNQLDSANSKMEDLQVENDRLNIEMENLSKQKQAANKAQMSKNVAKTYETMSPQNVAAILMKMTDEQAVSILSQLNTDQQAQVLEKLPPDTAAKYTRLLANP